MSNLSFVRHTGDGFTKQYLLSVAGDNIGYFHTSDIHAYVDDVEVALTINPSSPHLVLLAEAPPLGSDVLIRREVAYDKPYADFERGNNFGKRQVNNTFLQQLYLTQQMLDGFFPEGFYLKSELNAGGFPIKNVGNPSVGADAVNLTTLLEYLSKVEAGKPRGKTISPTPPEFPLDGDGWWQSTTGKSFLWYEDGDSGQWVEETSATQVAPDGGGSGVDSVNGQSGTVTLDAGDIEPTTDRLWWTQALQSVLDGKQVQLLSGTNIKTINGASILGAGNIVVGGGGGGGGAVDSVNGQTGVVTLDADNIAPTATRLWWSTSLQLTLDGKQEALVSGTNIKTINGVSLLGSGDLTIGGGGGGDMYKATYDPTGVNGDAFDRANHTGSIAISDVTSLSSELNGKEIAGVAANLIATHKADADAHTQYAKTADLAEVATSGSYNDLTDKPASGVGEANDGNNLGTGVGVYRSKTGVNINLRSFTSNNRSVIIQGDANYIDLSVTFANIANKPTTLAGYGIIDAAAQVHNHTASQITSGTFSIGRIPTGTTSSTVAIGNHTHSGYAPTSHTHTFSSITRKPTTLNGYGITNAVATGTTASQTLSGQLTATNLRASKRFDTTTTTAYFYVNGTERMRLGSSGMYIVGNSFPSSDNSYTSGLAGNRWSVVYAATPTINTSDERTKTTLEMLSDAELACAKELKGCIRKYKFLDSVERKGDDARIHIGAGTQTVIEIFKSHGLDPFEYGIVCYDEWEDEWGVDDDDNKIQTTVAGNRYGLRYSELLAFIIAAL